MPFQSSISNHQSSIPFLILLNSKPNRHSVKALLAAVEAERELDRVEFALAGRESQLVEQVAEALAATRRPVVGVSFTTLQRVGVEPMMARLVGQFPQGVLWVAGGPHPTADPEGTLRMGFDVVVRGEGEGTLVDLLRTVDSGGELSAVAGIALRGNDGSVVFTGRREPVDLDLVGPFPLRRQRIVGPIEITRGCPFACGYCQTSHLLGVRPRHRSVETIARYAGVIRQRNLRDVRIISPNAFSYGSVDGRTHNPAALEALLSTLRDVLGSEGRFYFGTFPSEVRPEHVDRHSVELVKRFANNDSLVIGAQSGSQRMLRNCGRGHGVAEIFSSVSHTLAAGLKAQVDFIFGLPGETAEDLDESIAVIRELAAMGASIHAHTFMPLPQTRFAAEPPGRIHGRLRKVIKELIHRDALTGVWDRQEKAARRIAEERGGE